MRIGILGGTFDPPHKGHTALAIAALESLALDEVLFVPANRNPDKAPPTTPARHRLEMVRLAIQGDERFSVSDLEIKRGGPSFAVETIDQLRFALVGDYWFILGSDALKQLPKWKQPERILKQCRIAVASRPTEDLEKLLSRMSIEQRSRIDSFPLEPQRISSSEIRKRLATGEPTEPWLDPAVKQYIVSHNLYRSTIDN